MNLSRSELFVQYLTHTIGDYTNLYGIESEDDAMGLVLAITYQNYPEKGLLTAFTYGLSEATHPEWKTEKPELSITVESSDEQWGVAIANLVEWYRKDDSFLPGSLFQLGKPVSGESAMDSFLVFNLAIGKENEFQKIEMNGTKISIYGVHPLYHSEVELIKKIGIRKLMQLKEYRLFSVTRPDLSALYKVGGM
jgi:hypothetical protein